MQKTKVTLNTVLFVAVWWRSQKIDQSLKRCYRGRFYCIINPVITLPTWPSTWPRFWMNIKVTLSMLANAIWPRLAAVECTLKVNCHTRPTLHGSFVCRTHNWNVKTDICLDQVYVLIMKLPINHRYLIAICFFLLLLRVCSNLFNQKCLSVYEPGLIEDKVLLAIKVAQWKHSVLTVIVGRYMLVNY